MQDRLCALAPVACYTVVVPGWNRHHLLAALARHGFVLPSAHAEVQEYPGRVEIVVPRLVEGQQVLAQVQSVGGEEATLQPDPEVSPEALVLKQLRESCLALEERIVHLVRSGEQAQLTLLLSHATLLCTQGVALAQACQHYAAQSLHVLQAQAVRGEQEAGEEEEETAEQEAQYGAAWRALQHLQQEALAAEGTFASWPDRLREGAASTGQVPDYD